MQPFQKKKIPILHFLVLYVCNLEKESEPNVAQRKWYFEWSFARRNINVSNELTPFAAFPAKRHCNLSLSRPKYRKAKTQSFSE